MEYYPFDSRNPLYKSIYGAIGSDTTLNLRLLLHADAKVKRAFICIKEDSNNNFTEYEMTAGDYLDSYRFYSIEKAFSEGLYWYYFRYESDYGGFKVTKTDHSLGIVSNDGGLWQLTVYDKNFTTPKWLSGGIIYQIFPDRFYFSGGEKKNVPSDRYYAENWSDTPIYTQNDPIKYLGNDYYRGDLKGITEKLDYLESLGVTAIYLNPIFEAHSNHRYNTADYMKIDPLLGTEEDLIHLCKKAEEKGIGIILDGVFSHTGDDSIYFNKYGRYPLDGSFNKWDSKYKDWYTFKNYPHSYNSWWGISTLPETNEENPSFNEYINGKEGVIRHYIKLGIKGWRLDVADELPDIFLDNLRSALKEENEQAFLLGEVWEDATNKFSHGGRRRYLRGKQLDSVMNYPFAQAIIDFLRGGNSRELIDSVLSITENYPPQCVDLLMNHIGTHDTARILTVLGEDTSKYPDRSNQACRSLNEEQLEKAVKFLKLAATLQYTLPGVPSLYYGDEAGMEGYGDPFCRKTFPWGKENKELLSFYRFLGKLRKENSCFKGGKFIPVYANMGHIAYIRESLDGKNALLVAVNRWCDSAFVDLPEKFKNCQIIKGQIIDGKLIIDSEDIAILKI